MYNLAHADEGKSPVVLMSINFLCNPAQMIDTLSMHELLYTADTLDTADTLSNSNYSVNAAFSERSASQPHCKLSQCQLLQRAQ